ncbi:MAG: hypothetical protein EXR48_03130 [Dehalococcoidia bacterium]|nr:hypothetical protein [Dehalococcoidia bacterium]
MSRSMRARRLALLGALLALLALVGLAGVRNVAAQAAQPLVTVEETGAESKFPDGILFNVRVGNPEAVKAVTVRFTIIGGKVPRYDYLPVPDPLSGASEVLVRTSTAAQYIPPGVLMEYSIEVEDTAGNTATSAPQQFVFDDPRFKWEELNQGDVSIRYYGPVQKRAQTVLEAANDTVERIGKGLFGLETVSPVRLTLYNNWSDMQTALPPTSRTQRGELITEGTTFSQYGIILLIADDPGVRGLASHEMTHFLVHDAIGNLDAVLSVWMNEGLAEYGNLEPSQVYEQYLTLAIQRGTLKPLTSLTQMPGKSDDVIVVYGQGRSVMEYLIEREPNGTEKLRKVFAFLRQGFGMDHALTEAYGFDRFGLDQRWRASIGLPPLILNTQDTPLPEAERPVVKPLTIPEPTVSGEPQPPAASAQPSAAQPEEKSAGSGGCSAMIGGPLDLGMWLGLGGLAALVAVRRLRL